MDRGSIPALLRRDPVLAPFCLALLAGTLPKHIVSGCQWHNAPLAFEDPFYVCFTGQMRHTMFPCDLSWGLIWHRAQTSREQQADLLVLLWSMHRVACEEHRNCKKINERLRLWKHWSICLAPMDFNGCKSLLNRVSEKSKHAWIKLGQRNNKLFQVQKLISWLIKSALHKGFLSIRSLHCPRLPANTMMSGERFALTINVFPSENAVQPRRVPLSGLHALLASPPSPWGAVALEADLNLAPRMSHLPAELKTGHSITDPCIQSRHHCHKCAGKLWVFKTALMLFFLWILCVSRRH